MKVQEAGSLLKLLKPYVRRHRAVLVVGVLGAVIGSILSFSVGVGIRWIIDGLPANANEGYAYLNAVLFVLVAVFVLATLINFVSSYSLVKVSTRVVRDLRQDVFSKLIGQNVSYLEQHPSGELQTRMIADTDTLGGFASQQVTKIATAAISGAAGICGALFISGRLAMIAIACLPFVFLPILLWGRRIRDFGAETQKRTADLGKETGEIFRNVKVVHVHNQEAQETSRFRQLADAVATTTVRSSRLQIALGAMVGLAAMTGTLVLMWSAARGIYSGAMTVGELMSFAFFNFQIIQSVGTFFGLAAFFKLTLGAVQRIMEYMSVEARERPANARLVRIGGTIEFRDVHFKYPARPQIDVLRGVNFVVEAGTHVVIVGPSGAGKSALFELLLGLYTPDAGAILIDGTDCRELGHAQLRAAVGYVPQKESLRSGTVLDNIAYGASCADQAKVVEAAELACAHDFITQLPQGYETDLGEVAARLSGGQKQRISLARALIREPRILLLDEDKSALDANIERRVSSSVRKWAAARGATVISIAHRLASIDRADRIMVVDGGAVVGSGSHEELLRSCEAYRNLVFSHAGHGASAMREGLIPSAEISAA